MPEARFAGPQDFDRIREILHSHPIESIALSGWLDEIGRAALKFRTVWLHEHSVCVTGPVVMPVNLTAEAAQAFAALAATRGRTCSSIIGWHPYIADFWQAVAPHWGPARAIRERQLVMIRDRPPAVAPDKAVRRATVADLDDFYHASIQMYIEEIGESPVARDGGRSYRARTANLIDQGHAFVRTDGAEVVFKAELGAVSQRRAQVQGIWVHPRRRGQGLGAAGTAQVVQLAHQAGIDTVTLAVNDFNTAAVRAYESCGFSTVAEQMVVLF